MRIKKNIKKFAQFGCLCAVFVPFRCCTYFGGTEKCVKGRWNQFDKWKKSSSRRKGDTRERKSRVVETEEKIISKLDRMNYWMFRWRVKIVFEPGNQNNKKKEKESAVQRLRVRQQICSEVALVRVCLVQTATVKHLEIQLNVRG